MGNLNPYYNESFVFIVEQEMLRVSHILVFSRSYCTDAPLFAIGLYYYIY